MYIFQIGRFAFIFTCFCHVLVEGANTFSGNATWYNTDPNLLTACGRAYNNDAVIVAVSTEHWSSSDPNHDPICNKVISVTDPSSNNGFSLSVMIEDKCGICGRGDLDLSPEAFMNFHELSVGVFPVQWYFVE